MEHIPCVLCNDPVELTAQRRVHLLRGARIACKRCDSKISSARALISRLQHPALALIAAAKDLEQKALEMLDGEEIEIIAMLGFPKYRKAVNEWLRLSGRNVEVLPPQPDPVKACSDQPFPPEEAG